MSNIFPIDFEEKLTMAQDDYILFSDSEDGNKIKKAQYKNLKGEPGTPGTPGKDGEDGTAATITVGSTTTGAAGSSASVTNSGTSSAAVLDFTIPQGAKGEPGEDGQDGADGAAATITVGTTTTLPAGSSATVTNVGTSQDAILDFGIPKGDSGTGSGDVIGPASSTDGHLAVFDGATGKLIKDGGAIPTGDVGVSTDTGTLLSAGVDLWLGTETDFSSISTPDTNTLYIQYKSDGGGGWQPGVNTVAYYPLDTDFDDASGNGYDLTATNATITTLDGIDCAYYTAGKAINTSAPVGSVRTLSAWVYNITTTGNPVIIGTGANQYSFYGMFLVQFSGVVNISDLHAQSIAGNSISQNAWHHLVAVNDNTTMKIYIDGTLVNSGTHTRTDSSTGISVGGVPFTDQYGQDCTGYISNAIVESVAWSDQDVSDYYDLTKGDYGIS